MQAIKDVTRFIHVQNLTSQIQKSPRLHVSQSRCRTDAFAKARQMVTDKCEGLSVALIGCNIAETLLIGCSG